MSGGDLQPLVSEERMFPVLQGAGRRGEKVYVPWKLVAAHAKQCMKNHSQTVERLAERGGLCGSELAAVLEDREWRSMKDSEAWAAVFKASVDQLAPVPWACGECGSMGEFKTVKYEAGDSDVQCSQCGSTNTDEASNVTRELVGKLNTALEAK